MDVFIVIHFHEKIILKNILLDNLFLWKKKKIILSTTEAEKQQAEAINKSLHNDIEILDEEFKKFFEGQIGHKITTKEEFEKYYKENETFNKTANFDVEVIQNLKKSKEKNKIFTKLEKQKLLNLKIKYTNMKKSDIEYINTYNAIILKDIDTLLN